MRKNIFFREPGSTKSGKETRPVILDRFKFSSYAYQIYGRKRLDLKKFVDELSKNIVPENFVDKYYFFDLDVEISKKRELTRKEETSRFDAESIQFFNNVRNGYKTEIKRFKHKIIDAYQSEEKVRKVFIKEVVDFLAK